MRLNTVNEKYIMLKSEEISKLIFELKKRTTDFETNIEEVLNYILKLYSLIKDYYFKNNYVPSEIAVSPDSEISNLLLENINYKISVKDIHNSFMHAIMIEDEENAKLLKELLRCHEAVTYEDITRIYGKELASYIRKNKDYDYIDNVNRVNIKDSNVILYDGEKLINLDLVDSELVLQNKSVNQ